MNELNFVRDTFVIGCTALLALLSCIWSSRNCVSIRGFVGTNCFNSSSVFQKFQKSYMPDTRSVAMQFVLFPQNCSAGAYSEGR